MTRKQIKTMCMVGRFAYEGIRAFLTDFFEPGAKYPKEYLKESIDRFYDETGMRLEFYNDDYDMVTFMRNKIYLINRNPEGEYYLNEDGEYFRGLLLSDEERFKVELSVWIYKKSRRRFSGLSDFVDRLKLWLERRGPSISDEEFHSLVRDTLGSRFNEGAVYLLESLGFFARVVGGYTLQRNMFATVSSRQEELSSVVSLMKSASTNGKMMLKEAIRTISSELGTTEKESMEMLEELEESDHLIIRSTRGGKYVEF